jgi:transcriptional regulator with XRE-family HTH domain
MKTTRNIGVIHFGKRIGFTVKRLRTSAGFTRASLAKSTGISYSIVKRLEGGLVYNPQLNAIYGIANALGISLRELLEESKII